MLNTRRDVLLLLVVAGGIFAATGGIFVVFGTSPWSWAAVLALAAALWSATLLICYRRMKVVVGELREEAEHRDAMLYRQMEAYMQLQRFIEPRLPLPSMRGMAISPDFALLLLQQILRTRPLRIVELGCGTSTLISSYCLERLGAGDVISIDHESVYACQCRELLQAHGLASRANIREAPLTPAQLNGQEWKYYDRTAFENLGPIDLLVVDGPPVWTGDLARYPALPLLYPQLSSRAVVLIDDAARRDDQRMVQRWLEEFPEFEAVRLETEKGATLLRRKQQ
jgi:predicted O-methyltransferase YrrM